VIRPALPSDADALGELQLSCWHEAYGALAPSGTLDAETLDNRVRVWTGLLEREMNILVLEIDGALDGFAAYGPARDDDVGEETGELYALYLRAARQGVGLGRRLQDNALAPLADGGATAAIAWMLAANERARGFYEAAGWSFDDRIGPKPMRWGLPEVRYRRTLP
jgi:GNAT superfamily N-acetyltransferase